MVAFYITFLQLLQLRFLYQCFDMGKSYKCCKWCTCHLPKTTKLLCGSDIDSFKLPLVQPVSAGDVLCQWCLTRAKDKACEPFEDITTVVTADNAGTSDPNPEPNKKLKLDVPKTGSGSSSCIVCGTKKASERPFYSQHLKPEARARVFSKTGIFVPAQSRACLKQFEGDNLLSD